MLKHHSKLRKLFDKVLREEGSNKVDVVFIPESELGNELLKLINGKIKKEWGNL